MMEDKIVKVLNTSPVPMKAGEIAEAAGIEKKDVDRIIKKLKTDNIIESPKKCYYSLKK